MICEAISLSLYYMVGKLGIEESKVPFLSQLLYKDYGTTMSGLRAIGYKFDYDDFHSFVHGRLPYDKLKLDPTLRNLLLSLPIRKVVGTSHRSKGADHPLESIHGVREALLELWEGADKADDVQYSGKLAIETSVIALFLCNVTCGKEGARRRINPEQSSLASDYIVCSLGRADA